MSVSVNNPLISIRARLAESREKKGETRGFTGNSDLLSRSLDPQRSSKDSGNRVRKFHAECPCINLR